MGVHIPIFGIAAVARLPRKDNKKSVIASEAAAWAFVQLVYCHSERSEESPGRVVYRGVTIAKTKISIASPKGEA